MEIPNFLRKVDNSLVFDQEGELVYYIPEEFFDLRIAEIIGSYVSLIGVFDYGIISPSGSTVVRSFNFPTVFLCKPSEIEKAKSIKVGKSKEENDYVLLHFHKGDEVISETRVPQVVDNCEDFYRLMIMTGKVPTTIPYDKGQDYFIQNGWLNGVDYGMNLQLFGLIWSEICRDPEDISKPFCMSGSKDMNAYKPVSIKLLPNYISPYVSLASEQLDESIRAAIVMDEKDYQDTPLERIVTG